MGIDDTDAELNLLWAVTISRRHCACLVRHSMTHTSVHRRALRCQRRAGSLKQGTRAPPIGSRNREIGKCGLLTRDRPVICRVCCARPGKACGPWIEEWQGRQCRCSSPVEFIVSVLVSPYFPWPGYISYPSFPLHSFTDSPLFPLHTTTHNDRLFSSLLARSSRCSRTSSSHSYRPQ